MNTEHGIVVKENDEITETEKLELIDLLNETVCFGLMDYERITNYLNNDIVKVLKKDDNILGLVIFKRIENYLERIKGNKNILDKLYEKNFGKSGEVYTIDLLAIKEKEREKGYGHTLLKDILTEYKDKEIIRYIWLSRENEIKLNSLLGADFIKLGEIEDYWFEENVNCPYCTYKCRCPIVVAVKKQ